MSGETRGSRGELATSDRPWRYRAHARTRPVKVRWARANRTRLTLLFLMRCGRHIEDGQPLNRGALMRHQVGVRRWVCRSTRLARCCWSMHADKLAALILEVGLSGPGDQRGEAQYLAKHLDERRCQGMAIVASPKRVVAVHCLPVVTSCCMRRPACL